MATLSSLPSRPLTGILQQLSETDRARLHATCKATKQLPIRAEAITRLSYTREMMRLIELVEHSLEHVRQNPNPEKVPSFEEQLKAAEIQIDYLKSYREAFNGPDPTAFTPETQNFVHALVTRLFCTLHNLNAKQELVQDILRGHYFVLRPNMEQGIRECTYDPSFNAPIGRSDVFDLARRGFLEEAIAMALATKNADAMEWTLATLCCELQRKNRMPEMLTVCDRIFAWEKETNSRQSARTILHLSELQDYLHRRLVHEKSDANRTHENIGWILSLASRWQEDPRAKMGVRKLVRFCMANELIDPFVFHLQELAKERDISIMARYAARMFWRKKELSVALRVMAQGKTNASVSFFKEAARTYNNPEVLMDLLNQEPISVEMRSIGYSQLLKCVLKEANLPVAKMCLKEIHDPIMKSHAHYLIAKYYASQRDPVRAGQHVDFILEDYQQMRILGALVVICASERDYETAFSYAMAMRDQLPDPPTSELSEGPKTHPKTRSRALLDIVAYMRLDKNMPFQQAALFLKSIPDHETREQAVRDLIVAPEGDGEQITALFLDMAEKIRALPDQALVDMFLRGLIEDYSPWIPDTGLLHENLVNIANHKVRHETLTLMFDEREIRALDNTPVFEVDESETDKDSD